MHPDPNLASCEIAEEDQADDPAPWRLGATELARREKAAIEEQWLPLQPGPDGGEVVGELLVSVEAESPLLSEDDFEESSVLTVHLHAMHKLPERWLPRATRAARSRPAAGALHRIARSPRPHRLPCTLLPLPCSAHFEAIVFSGSPPPQHRRYIERSS